MPRVAAIEMKKFWENEDLRESEIMIAFSDFTNFSYISRNLAPLELFLFMNEYYERSSLIIENEGGKILKFIADSSVIIFPQNKSDDGVKALLKLKEESELWLNSTRTLFKKHTPQILYIPTEEPHKD
jgi:class 3 adenylate cyclase